MTMQAGKVKCVYSLLHCIHFQRYFVQQQILQNIQLAVNTRNMQKCCTIWSNCLVFDCGVLENTLKIIQVTVTCREVRGGPTIPFLCLQINAFALDQILDNG